MKGGYESMVWLNDSEGHEFVCYIDDIGDEVKSMDELTENQARKCLNVNELIGTERW